jgi:hypothetical protein
MIPPWDVLAVDSDMYFVMLFAELDLSADSKK